MIVLIITLAKIHDPDVTIPQIFGYAVSNAKNKIETRSQSRKADTKKDDISPRAGDAIGPEEIISWYFYDGTVY